MHEQAPPHYHRQGLKGSSHITAVVRVAGEQRTQVEQGGRMLAKERASGACHMCQCSGCAAGAGTAHGVQPSIAHDFGLWALFGLQRVVEIAHVGQTSACFIFKSNPFFFGFGGSFWWLSFEKRTHYHQNKPPEKDIGIPATKINRIGETVQPKVPNRAGLHGDLVPGRRAPNSATTGSRRRQTATRRIMPGRGESLNKLKSQNRAPAPVQK